MEAATAVDTNTPASVVEASDRNDQDNNDKQSYDAVQKPTVIDDKVFTVKPSAVNRPAVIAKPGMSKRTMMRCATARPAVVQPTVINTRNSFAVLESLPQEGRQPSRSATKKKRPGTRRRRAQRAANTEAVEQFSQQGL